MVYMYTIMVYMYTKARIDDIHVYSSVYIHSSVLLWQLLYSTVLYSRLSSTLVSTYLS